MCDLSFWDSRLYSWDKPVKDFAFLQSEVNSKSVARNTMIYREWSARDNANACLTSLAVLFFLFLLRNWEWYSSKAARNKTCIEITVICLSPLTLANVFNFSSWPPLRLLKLLLNIPFAFGLHSIYALLCLPIHVYHSNGPFQNPFFMPTVNC